MAKLDGESKDLLSSFALMVDYIRSGKIIFPKSLSIHKFAKEHKVSEEEIIEISKIIIKLQDYFKDSFSEYDLKLIEMGRGFLTFVKNGMLEKEIENEMKLPNNISIKKTQMEVLLNLIHHFTEINPGSELPLKAKDSNKDNPFMKKVQKLYEEHKYFFIKSRKEGFFYPCPFAVTLVQKIKTFKTVNRDLKKIKVGDREVIIVDD